MADEVDLSCLPLPKVIKDGKQVDTSSIDDYDGFMGFLMQASIAANTAKIRRYYDDRRSKGLAFNYDLAVTEEFLEITCPQPCQTLYVENTGVPDIYLTLNSPGIPTIITTTRSAYFEFETHVIERFYVWTLPGTASTAVAMLKY